MGQAFRNKRYAHRQKEISIYSKTPEAVNFGSFYLGVILQNSFLYRGTALSTYIRCTVVCALCKFCGRAR